MYLWMQFALRLLPKVHDLSLHLCWKQTFLLSLKSSLQQSKSPARDQLLTLGWGACYKICSFAEGSVKDLCALRPCQRWPASPRALLSWGFSPTTAVSLLLCPCFAAHPDPDHEVTCWLDPDLPHHHNLVWWSEPVVEFLCCPQACSDQVLWDMTLPQEFSALLASMSNSGPHFFRQQLVLTVPWEGEVQVFKKRGVQRRIFDLVTTGKIGMRSFLFHTRSLPKPILPFFSAKCLWWYLKYFNVCPIYYLFLFLQYDSSACGGTE